MKFEIRPSEAGQAGTGHRMPRQTRGATQKTNCRARYVQIQLVEPTSRVPSTNIVLLEAARYWSGHYMALMKCQQMYGPCSMGSGTGASAICRIPDNDCGCGCLLYMDSIGRYLDDTDLSQGAFNNLLAYLRGGDVWARPSGVTPLCVL